MSGEDDLESNNQLARPVLDDAGGGDDTGTAQLQRPRNMEGAGSALPIQPSNKGEGNDEGDNDDKAAHAPRSLMNQDGQRILLGPDRQNFLKPLESTRDLQQLSPPPGSVEYADVCVSITLGDSSGGGGLASPISSSGLRVCPCDESNECIDENIPSAANGGNGNGNQLRICLSSEGGSPLEEISLLQLDDLSSGGSLVIFPYDAGDADNAMADGMVSMHPNAAFELRPDGKLGVITLLMDDSLFESSRPPPTNFAVLGVAVLGDREESFQLEVDFTSGAASSGPCEAQLDFDDLNLSNIKEVGGCSCQITTPTPSLALALPPDDTACPDPPLVSTPANNEVTL